MQTRISKCRNVVFITKGAAPCKKVWRSVYCFTTWKLRHAVSLLLQPWGQYYCLIPWSDIYIYMRFIKVDYFALITKYKLSNCSKSKPKKESTQNGICLEIITSDYRLLWNGRTCCSQLASHVLFYSMTKTCFSIFNWYGNEYTSTISNGDNVLGYTSK